MDQRLCLFQSQPNDPPEHHKLLVGVFVAKLKLFNEQQAHDLLKFAHIQLLADQSQLTLIFQLTFTSLPHQFFLNYFLEHAQILAADQKTHIKFVTDLTALINPHNLVILIQNYFESQQINNWFIHKLVASELSISDHKISFVISDEAAWAAHNVVITHLKRFLKFVTKQPKLQVEILDQTTSALKIAQVANQPVVRDQVIATPAVKVVPEVMEVWAISEKTLGNKTYPVIQLSGANQFYCCAYVKKPSVKFKKLTKNQLIRPKIDFFQQQSQFQYADGILVDFEVITPEAPAPLHLHEGQFTNLFVHSKYSTQDGLCDFSQLVTYGQKHHHQTFAICDWNSVSGYPLVEQITNQTKTKPIYGVELEVLNDLIEIVSQAEQYSATIIDATYCLLDLETTGLMPAIDDIIEIAVHKYQNNILIDTWTTLIKTDQVLKPEIIKLTQITNELLVESGIELETALKQFLQFVGTSVLVAHNGLNFDFLFLQAHLVKCNLPPLTNPLVDSLQIARALFSQERSLSLEAVAKKLEINYNKAIAHRALYDTGILAEVFFKLLSYLTQHGIDLNGPLIQLNDQLQSAELMKRNFPTTICVYAKNQAGIKRIYQLVSQAHTKNFLKVPTVFWSELNQDRKNLIIANSPDKSDLWACVTQAQRERFQKLAQQYDYIFLPSVQVFLHEIQRNFYSQAQCEYLIQQFYLWAQAAKIPTIAAVPVKYLTPMSAVAYATLVYAKKIGNLAHHLYSYHNDNSVLPDYHYRTVQELVTEYAFLKLSSAKMADLLWINNEKFVNSIANDIVIVPKKLAPPTFENLEKQLTDLVHEKFRAKYFNKAHELLVERLAYELNAILRHQFGIFYWVSYLLVKQANHDGYLVASRGSVGSSLVAYLINISEVNPMPPHYYCMQCGYNEFHLDFADSGFDLVPKACPDCQNLMYGDGQNIPFATFMGFNADKVPDIDLNFSGEYQISAHNFLKKLFGETNCFRAGTILKIKAKTAYGYAKNYLEATNTHSSIGLVDWIISNITDVKRTSGQHAGGIVVVPQEKSIDDFSPIIFPADDLTSEWKTTHIEYDHLHDGLVKFDVLGHDDPTMLKILYELTGMNPRHIPNYDLQVLKLFTSCEPLKITPEAILDETTGAIGLPEYGTQFVRKVLKDAQPQGFGDLIRISGLTHGTDVWTNNAETLIKKHNYQLAQVICCRDDIMMYLMQQNVEPLVAFNVMESVRKGKQIPANAIAALEQANIPDWYMKSANLIKYMFPKAHAAAYALMAWRVAYYKLYYPTEYYATYFSIRSDKFDLATLITNDPQLITNKYKEIKARLNNKSLSAQNSVNNKEKELLVIYEVALEMIARGIKFLNIDLAHSAATRYVPIVEQKAILIPFVAIDGLGEKIACELVVERAIQPFKSKQDLLARTKLSQALLKKLEAFKITAHLTNSGQLSLFEIN